MMLFAQVCLFAQTTDSLSGGAGWIGAGLLGAVLAWLLLKHLPDKDKQIRDLMVEKDSQMTTLIKISLDERTATFRRYDEEREKERASRHERATNFQSMLNSLAITFTSALQTQQQQHVTDAKADRDAFTFRQDTLLAAITAQTDALKVAFHEGMRDGMKMVCQWRPHN